MPNLYPTFTLPKIAIQNTEPSKRIYKPAPMFDYDSGDFVRDNAGRLVMADGKEAYIEWCLKQCVTERGTRLAYSDKIGVEMVSALKNNESDPKAVQSAIEKTITEALMIHPATEYVRKFKFTWDGGSHLFVTFIVKGYDWEEETLTVTY